MRALQIACVAISSCYVDCLVPPPSVAFRSSGLAVPKDQSSSARMTTVDDLGDSSSGKRAYLKSRVKSLLSTIRSRAR
jgi:hypothetical protein